MKAVWKNTILAESDDTVVVEGNHYFPPESLRRELFVDSNHATHCPWKGDASYRSVRVGDDLNENAAWFYPDPKPAAEQIRGRFAFWRGVEVTE
jgi:uncharacterized protein (DUF427 family)